MSRNDKSRDEFSDEIKEALRDPRIWEAADALRTLRGETAAPAQEVTPSGTGAIRGTPHKRPETNHRARWRRKRKERSIPGTFAWTIFVWPILRLAIGLRSGAEHFGLARPGPDVERDGQAWWRENLHRSICRAVDVGRGGGTRFLLYSLAVVIPLLLLFFGWQSGLERPWLWLALSVPSSALVALTLLAVGVNYRTYVSIRAQPPKEFASIALSGRSPTDILRILAWEIRSTCEFFLDAVEPLHGTLPDKEEEVDDFPLVALFGQLRTMSGEELPELARLVRDEPLLPMQLRRLRSLKTQAADLMGVKRKRFCNHILQYSPELHADFGSKYVANWEYITSVGSYERPGPLLRTRCKSLVRENIRIVRKVRERVQLAKLLFKFDSLHPYINGMALSQAHPSSDATLAYARGVAHAARQYSGSELDAALGFLHRKRQAREGSDLHRACVRVCEEVLQRLTVYRSLDSQLVRKQRAALLSIPKRSLHSDQTTDSRPSEKDEALKDLAMTVETYAEWSGEAVLDNFSKLAKAWFTPRSGPNASPGVIVTIGFSRTVRQVLKAGLEPVPRGSRVNQSRAFPSVCVLGGEESLPTRKMIYELTSDARYRRNVCEADEAQALQLLERGSPSMIVVGLEAFDADWCVGSADKLTQARRLKDALGSSASEHCLIVLVAGGYKHARESLHSGEGDFYRHHMNQVTLHDHDTWDFLVSDGCMWGKKDLEHRLPTLQVTLPVKLKWDAPGLAQDFETNDDHQTESRAERQSKYAGGVENP